MIVSKKEILLIVIGVLIILFLPVIILGGILLLVAVFGKYLHFSMERRWIAGILGILLVVASFLFRGI